MHQAAVIYHSWVLFFEDNEEDVENVFNGGVDNFAEMCVPRMKDWEFKYHFRLNRIQFNDICEKLNESYETDVCIGRPEIITEKQVMITLWYLSNMESIRSISNRFNVSKSVTWNVLKRTCERLLKVNKEHKIISWPSLLQRTYIKEGFLRRGNFPGIIGAIDGTHIKINAPESSPGSYVNRKGYHSIQVQAVCDHKMRFLDCYIGEVGSVHDACVFRRSPLRQAIARKDIVFNIDEHIVGDSAYPLLSFLLVPFKNTMPLNDTQKKYNISLSKCRVSVEQAFGILKNKFRRLKYFETKRLDLKVLFIMGCFILYNISLSEEDEIIFEESTARNENVFSGIENEVEATNAISKRNNLLDYFA